MNMKKNETEDCGFLRGSRFLVSFLESSCLGGAELNNRRENERGVE